MEKSQSVLGRRGFISSLAGVVGWLAIPFKGLPAAAVSRRPCVACGAAWHVTSLCPINHTAMGGVLAIQFENATWRTAEAFINSNLPDMEWVKWAGLRVFQVTGRDGEKVRGRIMAFAAPRDYHGWPNPGIPVAVVDMRALNGGDQVGLKCDFHV